MMPISPTVPLEASEIRAKTGMSLEELSDIVRRTGLTQPRDVRSMFQREYSLGFSDATALARKILEKKLSSLP